MTRATPIVLMAPPSIVFMAPMVMARPTVMVDASRSLPVGEVRQRIVIAQFLELKPSTFVGDDRPERVKQ